MKMTTLRRVAWIGLLALAGGACGVPSAEDARLRPPPSGARTVFARPHAEVYRAAKAIVEAEQETPEWKELEVRVDDPDAGVLIAERVLEGIVPGVRVRDLWSFYVKPVGDERTEVTFVLESSDHPRPSVPARSWARGQGTIFPAMRQILDETEAPGGERETPSVATAPAKASAPPASSPRPAVPAAPRAAESTLATTTAGASNTTAPTTDLDRAYATLAAAPDWRASTRQRTVAGERVVAVGEWAQLSARKGRVQIAFPSYPAPPAYDVARLMRFLTEAGFAVDVLPGSAFRLP